MSQFTEQELEKLLKKEESESVEFCESPKKTDKIVKAICAFSNDMSDSQKTGIVFIGVKDNGMGARLSVTDEMQRNIAHIRSDGNLHPFPVISVRKIILRQCEMIIVEVQPSKNPPLRYQGRCWIRIGTTTRQASQEEENRLQEKREGSALPTDMKGITDASLSDLNMDYFKTQYLPSSVSPEILETNQRNLKNQMRSLRFLDPKGLPTATALLVAGKNTRNWFPGAYIQFVRFEGTNLTDPVKTQKEISGTLQDQIQKVEEVLESHISISLVLSDTTHIESADYPLTALRQLVRNAVIHRNYQSHTPCRVHWFFDRIEITNPGGPYGEVNTENFGKEGITSYRNPTIAEAMKNLGFAERFGFGIPQAKKALKENGNPELKFQIQDSYVLAEVRKKPLSESKGKE